MNGMFNNTVKKVLISALLLITIQDLIKGFSLDILSPILDCIIPGDIRQPIRLPYGIDLYVTRFMIRVANLFFALLFVYYLSKKPNINNNKILIPNNNG
uniref:Uncharacterized protein n=1 Tax=viral metagenome TaxID=1070528 RepID=A0A6C0F7R0_9ZZZZ|tara:strand:- start:7215 stop:7511 length:297 start_codon:yes stop_codon:yes gene_type:complete